MIYWHLLDICIMAGLGLWIGSRLSKVSNYESRLKYLESRDDLHQKAIPLLLQFSKDAKEYKVIKNSQSTIQTPDLRGKATL